MRTNRIFAALLLAAMAMLLACGAASAGESGTRTDALPLAQDALGVNTQFYFNLISEDDIPDMSSLYWPWVVETDGRVEGALGRYYMYFSTDHASTFGGVAMAYSDDLLSGWTYYGPVYKSADGDTPLETETPSVVWHEGLNKWLMFYQSADSYPGEAQTSWRVESEDGIHWTNRVKVFALDNKRLYGNLHNGYVVPFWYDGTLFAYSLMGGGNVGTALSWSDDGGLSWITDHRQLGRWSLEGGAYFSQNHGTVVRLQDEWWWLGLLTDFTSGTAQKGSRIALSHMNDLRSLAGTPYLLRKAEDPDFESDNIRSLSVLETGGKLYVFYQCCVGGEGGNISGKDYVNCMVIDEGMGARERESAPEGVIRIKAQPQDVCVEHGESARMLCRAQAPDGAVLAYQWRNAKTGEALEGAVAPELILPGTDTVGVELYVCEVSGPGLTSVISREAKAAVGPRLILLAEPEDVVVRPGETAALLCEAEADDGTQVAYQWYDAQSGEALPNGQTPRYDVPLDAPVGAAAYQCMVRAGSTVKSSRAATVVVADPNAASDGIEILIQPEDVTIGFGGTTTLTCMAATRSGVRVSYQWRFAQSGGKAPNGTQSTYVLPTDRPAGTVQYKCEITAPGCESVTSDVVTVTITAPTLRFETQPAHTGITEGTMDAKLSALAACSDGAPVDYQWYANTTNSSEGGAAIEGAVAPDYVLPGDLPAGAYYYYCVASSDTAEALPSDCAVVLVNLALDAAQAQTPDAGDSSLLPDDLYRHGRTLFTVSQSTSFLERDRFEAVVAQAYGLREALYQQQFQFKNAVASGEAFIGGFDTVSFVMNNGGFDSAIACELALDGMWFTKAPDALSVTFTDGINYVRIYSDDKRASSTPVHTRYEAMLGGVASSGVLAENHNILAQPAVLYSPRFRLDKTHGEISLWVCDQLLQSVKLEGLSALGETRVELRFTSGAAEDVSMMLRQITLRVDY